MKALVTGATGFIGSRLVRRLVQDGHQVAVLLRAGSDDSALQGLEVRRIRGDVTDAGAVRSALEGIEVCFHLAGLVSYWRTDARRQRAVNVGGTRCVLAAARQAGIDRLVHTSSVAAIGLPEGPEPADETQAWRPPRCGAAYFVTKREAEELVRSEVRRGLHAVIVNPAYVVGPGDVRFHDGNVFLDLQNGKLEGYFPGGNCWVDVDDVVAGHLAALERGRPGERYILGGENLSYRRAFELVAEALGVPPPADPIPIRLARPAAIVFEAVSAFTGRYPRLTRDQVELVATDLFYDSSRARVELGYTFRPFPETARRTVAWYREHGYLPPAEGGAATGRREGRS